MRVPTAIVETASLRFRKEIEERRARQRAGEFSGLNNGVVIGV